MKALPGVWASCAIAAVWPLVQPGRSATAREAETRPAATFPGWPETFEGKPWIRVPPSGRVARFAAGLGGETGVFEQGGRVVVLRWVASPSRAVHPIADCFRARGYRVKAAGLARDAAGMVWSELVADRGEERWRVRERITDEAGRSWTDVSAWYWAAQRGVSVGPWWAVTIATPENEA
ncbi:MAG TPA: hypothetical protein VGD81_06640 [Opitutaceae bacterium]